MRSMNCIKLVLLAVFVTQTQQVIIAQKYEMGMSYRGAYEYGERRYSEGDLEQSIFYYLEGSESMIDYLKRLKKKNQPTQDHFENWISKQNRLINLLTEWYGTFKRGRDSSIRPINVKPFYQYNLTVRPKTCEGESFTIIIDYLEAKKMAEIYADQELVDYFDIKIIGPRAYDGYDCEGQSIQWERPLQVRQKCDFFLQNYPQSKYLEDVEDIKNIALRDYDRLKKRADRNNK